MGLRHLNVSGGTALHRAAGNENSTAGLLTLLFEAGVDLNMRAAPCTTKWRWIFRFARWAVEKGTSSGLLQEVAVWEGVTPLMHAARRGKVADVCALLDMTADPAIKNAQGLTALELTRNAF